MADFRVRTPAIDPQAFANVLQRKRAMEDEQARYEQERKDNRLKRITDAVIAGQNIASNMLTIADKRQDIQKKRTEAEGQQELVKLFQEPKTLPDNDPLKSKLEPVFQADRNQRFMAALTKANLDETTKAMLKDQFTKPEPKQPNYQSKAVLYNGVPKEVLFDPNPALGESSYLDPITKERLKGDIKPIPPSNMRSEQMELNRIQRTSEKMGQDLNDLDIGSNSPAGISAKRALYAKSGLQLIKQAENQPGGVDKRQMAELQMEVARVLTGAGVITNEQLNNLATNTARSKVANWEEWLTNKPTGVNQQKFVERFKETLERQLNFHQGELDKNKQARMAKYANFAKKYPEEFDAVLEQAGYDTEKFKKTKKLVKSYEETPPEFQKFQNNALIDDIAKVLKIPRKK